MTIRPSGWTMEVRFAVGIVFVLVFAPVLPFVEKWPVGVARVRAIIAQVALALVFLRIASPASKVDGLAALKRFAGFRQPTHRLLRRDQSCALALAMATNSLAIAPYGLTPLPVRAGQ